MAINFLPISFQDSKTACDGLGAGFGGVAFLASCAKAGIAASTTATSRAPHLLGLFIVSLLVLLIYLGLGLDVLTSLFWASLTGSHSLTGRAAKRFSPRQAKPGPLAGFILRRMPIRVMGNQPGQA